MERAKLGIGSITGESMLHSDVGSVRSINAKDYVCTKRGESGFALFGPYLTFEPGSYVVTFELRKGGNTAQAEDVCCIVQVAAELGQLVLSSSEIKSGRLNANESTFVDLPFTIDRPRNLEFRVHATGAEAIMVACERETRIIAGSGVRPPPELAGESEEHDEIFKSHLERFRLLYKLGAQIIPSRSGTLVDNWGVKFKVRQVDDLQLIDEIFIGHVYNFSSPADVVVIDIGMNIGLASLYFATLPFVKAVYGFEPFAGPFARAIEHFDLNPGLKAKIRPYNVGVAGAAETLEVLVGEPAAIGISIRGWGEGIKQTISVQEASKIFGDIIRDAHARGLKVVVKMDCEGSEFAIFQNLETSGLIAKIRVLMIEWHKWWSADKTQRDLIRPLLANGFDVFDQTSVLNPHAGMIFAIRAAA